MSFDRVRFEGIYRATTFRVEGPRCNIDIRIGSSSPEVDELLLQLGVTQWAYITAWNPGSRPTPAAQNVLAQVELLQIARARGFAFYEGEGIPDNEGWAPERSIWIAGIIRREAVEMGRQFGQNAIVVGRLGGVAELVCCSE
jgi:hypothetical protein